MTETQQDLMAFEKLTKMKESFFKEIVFFDVFFEDFKKVKRIFLSSLLTSSVIEL